MEKESEKTILFHVGITFSEYFFCRSIVFSALYKSEPPNKQKQYDEILKSDRERLKLQAQNCPDNFEYKYRLLEAEASRIEGRHYEALNFYEGAIESAHEYKYTNGEALANEYLARYWMETGKERYAALHLELAMDLYKSWGALGKVSALVEEFPFLANRKVYSRMREISESSGGASRSAGNSGP